MTQERQIRSTTTTLSENRVLSYLVIFCVASGICLPFLTQPHDIDDPFILQLAANILNDPCDPLSGSSFWFQEPGRFFDEFRNPPLAGYLLSPIVALYDDAVVPLHLVIFAYLLCAAFSFHDLAIRFSDVPLSATLVMMLTPATMVQSHHIMPDLLSLSLFLGGMALLFRGLDSNSGFLIATAGFVGGFAALSKYSAFIIVPIGLMIILNNCERHTVVRAVLFSVMALVPNLVWFFSSLRLYGQCHPLIVVQSFHHSAGWLAESFIAMTVHLGANLPAVMLLLFFRFRKSHLVPALGFLVWAISSSVDWFWLSNMSRGAFCFFALCGVAVLLLSAQSIAREYRDGRALSESERHRIVCPLSVWTVIAAVGCIVGTPFMASRYLLFLFPPLILLLFRKGSSVGFRKLSSSTVQAIVWCTALVGFAVSLGDFQFSQMTQQLAQTLDSRYGNEKLFFTGHWGFQYAMQKVGFVPLDPIHSPEAGEYLAVPRQWSAQIVSPEMLAGKVAVERIRSRGRIPVTIMDPHRGVGFYYHRSRPVPWLPVSPTDAEIDVFFFPDDLLDTSLKNDHDHPGLE